MPPLKNLPNELILLVFQQIDDATALQAVACTCKKFREIAEICLYSQAIFTRRSPSDKLQSICRKESRLGCYVQNLQLLYSTRHHDFLETQPFDLHRFPCLKSFVSESPFCNAHSRVAGRSDDTWKLDMHAYLLAFEEASLLSSVSNKSKPLRNLKSCEPSPRRASLTNNCDLRPISDTTLDSRNSPKVLADNSVMSHLSDA